MTLMNSTKYLKQLILVLRKLFQKTEEEGTLFHSLYKASIILITKDG